MPDEYSDAGHLRIQEGTTEGLFYSGVFTVKVDRDVPEFPAQNKCAGIRVMRNHTCTCPPSPTVSLTAPCSDVIFFLVTCFAGLLILTYLL